MIEDLFRVREGLGTVLWRNGYRAATAGNGAVALGLMAGGLRPDVIVVGLPEAEADHFLYELRLSDGGRVPVIVISSDGRSNEWAGRHRCGGFLRPPFTEDEFVAEIGRVFRGG